MERNGGNRNTKQRYHLQHREPAAVHRLQFPRVGGERHGTEQTQRGDLPLCHPSRTYVFLYVCVCVYVCVHFKAIVNLSP